MATEVASQDQAVASVTDVDAVKAAAIDTKVAEQSPSINNASDETGSPVQEPAKDDIAGDDANTTSEPNDEVSKTQAATAAAAADEDVKDESQAPKGTGEGSDAALAQSAAVGDADPASTQTENATIGGDKRPREDSQGDSTAAAAEGEAGDDSQAADQPPATKKQDTADGAEAE